ncbi:hypothetical protein CAter282_2767 [Collimonas arenae]|uniref:Uncharacterized protein n=1 Tax=Collimonas arenae TaxID=279058 RepID=A0A127QKE2_9BURK|nr:hypothetical protein CAter282_2767 [Collimonas arenae]
MEVNIQHHLSVLQGKQKGVICRLYARWPSHAANAHFCCG